MKAEELKVTMYEGDTLVLGKHQDRIFQKCCECGVWHEIEVIRMDEDEIGFKFSQVDNPEVPINEQETNIIRGINDE